MEIICDYCGTAVHKPPSLVKGMHHKFCGRECSNKFKKGRSNSKLKKTVTVKCYACGTEKIVQPYRLKQSVRHFCTRECQFEWQKSDEYKKIHSKKKKRIEVICSFCNKTFNRKPSEVREHYNFCNTDCRNNYMSQNQINSKVIKPRINVNCLECGFPLAIVESVYKKNKHGSFCTQDCYWSWKSSNLIGENSPSYKRIKTNCNYCNKVIAVIPYDTSKGKHIFCSTECYWHFRSEFYCGENSPRWGITWSDEKKEEQRQRALQMLREGIFNRITSIQTKVNHLLEQLAVEYENEYTFKYYSVDNFLIEHDLVIEVMGDYWHSNPNKYKNVEMLNPTQLKMVGRDKSKKAYLKKYHKINVLYLWESDIKSNPSLCKELVRLYIINKGILSNYHSFNYSYTSGVGIQLKKSLLYPYFDN